MSLSLIWCLEFQVDLADTKESKDIPCGVLVHV
jgi:hypothetical protein